MHTNLAGRAGRWSAAHWKTAAFGWLAFAVPAVAVGSAVGAKQMKSWEITNGDSRRAEQILDQASFKTPARESFLIQSKSLTVDAEDFRPGIATVVRAFQWQPSATGIVSPGRPRAAGL